MSEYIHIDEHRLAISNEDGSYTTIDNGTIVWPATCMSLNDVNDANTSAATSISAAEREWVRDMQATPVVSKDDLFIMNTDRIIN